MLWKHPSTPEILNSISGNTLNNSLGIEFTEIGPDYITARMPVDHRTVQPARILHGGASAALAETLGSVASVMCLDDPMAQSPVGVELNCSHLRAAREGSFVTGTVRPYRVGRKMHVWNIEIHNAGGELVCVSRLTIHVIDRR